jgi:hypothetical protein
MGRQMSGAKSSVRQPGLAMARRVSAFVSLVSVLNSGTPHVRSSKNFEHYIRGPDDTIRNADSELHLGRRVSVPTVCRCTRCCQETDSASAHGAVGRSHPGPFLRQLHLGEFHSVALGVTWAVTLRKLRLWCLRSGLGKLLERPGKQEPKYVQAISRRAVITAAASYNWRHAF